MDILSISTKDTAECIITDPRTGKPTDISITVYGADSKAFRALAKSAAQARIKAKSEGREVDDESIEADAEFLSSLTTGWEGVELAGKALEFNKANAIKVFTLSAPIRNQVNAFIARTSNFLPKA